MPAPPLRRLWPKKNVQYLEIAHITFHSCQTRRKETINSLHRIFRSRIALRTPGAGGGLSSAKFTLFLQVRSIHRASGGPPQTPRGFPLQCTRLCTRFKLFHRVVRFLAHQKRSSGGAKLWIHLIAATNMSVKLCTY